MHSLNIDGTDVFKTDMHREKKLNTGSGTQFIIPVLKIKHHTEIKTFNCNLVK